MQALSHYAMIFYAVATVLVDLQGPWFQISQKSLYAMKCVYYRESEANTFLKM